MGGLEAAAEAWFAVAARITIGLAAGSLMVAAVLRKFPNVSPEARHGLWALVLLQGLLWFHIPVWVPATAQPEDQPAAQAESPTAAPGMPTVGQRSDGIAPLPSVTPRATPGPIESEPTIAEAASPPEANEADIGPKRAFSWKLVLAGVWAAGAALLVLVTAFRFWRLRFRVMAGATPASRSLQQSARELARRHGYHGRFRLLWSDCCEAPMLIGLARGTIVLPRWLASLPKEQTGALVAHEVAHLCRRDRLFAVLSFASCVLNYFNPFAWWAQRRMSASREASADRWVTQTAGYSRKDYGRGLLAVAEAMSRAQPGWLGSARRSSELRQRIQTMQESQIGLTHGQPWPARILGASLASAVVVSLISVRLSPPALAENPPDEAPSSVQPVGDNRAPPATPVRLQTSPWGEDTHGLQCRVKAPVAIEQGLPLEVTVELHCDPERLDAGVKWANFAPTPIMMLSLSERESAKTFNVYPRHPTTFGDGPGQDVPLDGTAIEPWEISFPLADVYEMLEPGAYRCRVLCWLPKPTGYWHGKPDDWDAAGFWHGRLASGEFDVEVLAQTPKTATLLLPKRLRVEKDLVQYRSEDAEKVTLPVRNGHFLAANLYCDGQLISLSGAVKPDDGNAIGPWHHGRDPWYDGTDHRQTTYTIEIYETSVPPKRIRDNDLPPGAGGYKVLWRKTFVVSVAEDELRKAQTTDVRLREGG